MGFLILFEKKTKWGFRRDHDLAKLSSFECEKRMRIEYIPNKDLECKFNSCSLRQYLKVSSDASEDTVAEPTLTPQHNHYA